MSTRLHCLKHRRASHLAHQYRLSLPKLFYRTNSFRIRYHNRTRYLRYLARCIAEPLLPGIHDVSHRIMAGISQAQLRKQAPCGVIQTTQRSPYKWFIEFPQVPGLSIAGHIDLMNHIKILLFIQLYCQLERPLMPSTVKPIIAGWPDFSKYFMMCSRYKVKRDILHHFRMFAGILLQTLAKFSLLHNRMNIMIPRNV